MTILKAWSLQSEVAIGIVYWKFKPRVIILRKSCFTCAFVFPVLLNHSHFPFPLAFVVRFVFSPPPFPLLYL